MNSKHKARAAHLDFVVIGAMKAGSTSVYRFLGRQPSVHILRNKEPHYFSKRYFIPSAYYRFLFKDRQPGMLCGEASTSYSNIWRYPRCAARIAKDAPNAKIIYLIRDPVERVASNLRHLHLGGRKVTVESEIVPEWATWNKSRYRDVLEAYTEHFPDSDIFVADIKDLQSDSKERERLLSFLGLDITTPELSLPRSNVSSERISMPPWVRWLAQSLAGDFLRDIVPTQLIRRLKATVKKPAPFVEADMASISRDALEKRFPERCAELRSQYKWTRERFIHNARSASVFVANSETANGAENWTRKCFQHVS